MSLPDRSAYSMSMAFVPTTCLETIIKPKKDLFWVTIDESSRELSPIINELKIMSLRVDPIVELTARSWLG